MDERLYVTHANRRLQEVCLKQVQQEAEGETWRQEQRPSRDDAARELPAFEPPQFVHFQHVEYPFEAFGRNIKGMVVLDLTIDESGKVAEAKLHTGLDPVVDKVAISTALRWRFSPAKRKGRPVRFALRIPICFTGVKGALSVELFNSSASSALSISGALPK